MAKSKKLALVGAAIVASFVLLTGRTAFATEVTSGDIVYDVNEEEGVATVNAVKGSLFDVVVKKSVKLGAQSFPVTAIGDDAFSHAAYTTVKLPETIESIGARAFYRCEFLTDINIPDGLKTVGDNAFGGCIIHPEFPNGAQVSENVFELQEEQGTEETGNDEGKGTESDGKVTDPGNQGDQDGNEEGKGKESDAGQSQSAGQAVADQPEPIVVKERVVDESEPVKPAQETTTETTATVVVETKAVAPVQAAVVDTFSLNGSKYELYQDGTAILKKVSRYKKTLRIPNTVSYQGKKYKVVRVEKNAAKNCDRLVKITLKGNLKEIGAGAFRGCKKLKMVNVKNVNTIGKKAFYGCKKLSSVKSNGKVRNIGAKAFGKCSRKLNTTELLK